MSVFLALRTRSVASNLRFGASGAVTRRNGSANLQASTPQEQQCEFASEYPAGTAV